MQLHYLFIPDFRNLRNAEFKFSTGVLPDRNYGNEKFKPIRNHVLIGQNGVGKSNLIEALITIFRNIDLGLDSEDLGNKPLNYTLEYEIRGFNVRLHSDVTKQKRPFVWVNGEKRSQNYLLKNKELLPSHIFAYYSGRNERIEMLFQEHQRRFNRRQEIVAEEVLPASLLRSFNGTKSEIRALDEAKRRESNRLNNFGDDRLRRLFYCRGGHSQLVLLACLLSDDPVFKNVLKNLHIESLESALFVLKEPHRLRIKRREGKFEEQELNEGDPRFWYARGNVVNEFLDKLWQVAWAPIEQEVDKQIDFRGRTEKQRQLYLYVPNQEKLKELGELVGSTDSFFRYAEGAYIGDMIDEVRITVKKSDQHGGDVSFTQLSEGELQMLTVLGLMRITRDDHCLFLLDEPDTHLNPIWKLRCFDDIEDALTNSEGLGAASESQVLLTTHDPILLGSLLKEQVHILRSSPSGTIISIPDEHPRGMGVAGLLKSELFGLTSTLDRRTLEDLDRRNQLLVKESKEGLTLDEQNELEQLKIYLTDLGFSREYRDPLYQLFIQKMYEARNLSMSNLLTPEQLEQQNKLAEQIAKNMLAEQRISEMENLANLMLKSEEDKS